MFIVENILKFQAFLHQNKIIFKFHFFLYFKKSLVTYLKGRVKLSVTLFKKINIQSWARSKSKTLNYPELWCVRAKVLGCTVLLSKVHWQGAGLEV